MFMWGTESTVRIRIATAVLSLFFAFCLGAQAGLISLDSGIVPLGQSQSNNISGANVILSNYSVFWKAPIVGGAQWISYGNTGMAIPGQDPPQWPDAAAYFGDAGVTAGSVAPTAIFYQTFNLPGSINTGGINVWADDTAAVLADGNLIFAAPAAGWVSACVDAPVGCSSVAGQYIDLSFLSAGQHTLQFNLFQMGTEPGVSPGPAGLLYAGTIESVIALPEPATYLMLGMGLLGFGALRAFRKR